MKRRDLCRGGGGGDGGGGGGGGGEGDAIIVNGERMAKIAGSLC